MMVARFTALSSKLLFFGLLYLSIIGGEKSIMHFRISIVAM